MSVFDGLNFYPRSPCGERREPTAFRTPHHKFLSTLSLRRATAIYPSSTPPKEYFYPRSPCGERPYDGLIASANFCHFYPRSPCGERPTDGLFIFYCRQFLSTLSLRRATRHCTTYLNCSRFLSTLSLRRATQNCCPYRSSFTHFYPRSPCGERPVSAAARSPA